MAKYVMIATSGAKAGQEAEFNKWYDEVHIPDVCQVPGVVAGRRFVALPEMPVSPPYIAIYELETDDPMAVMAEIGRRVESGKMVITPAIDSSVSGANIFKAI